MTLLLAEMEALAKVLQDAGRSAGFVTYADGHFGGPDYWEQPRVFERLAGTLVRQAGTDRCVFGARVLAVEDEVGTMIRRPDDPEDPSEPEGVAFEALWLLAIDLSEGVEIGVVRRTPNGWGALRICADQVQLTPEAPGYWLMQEMLGEET